MNRNLLVGIVLVVAIAGGAYWYVGMPMPAANSNTPEVTVATEKTVEQNTNTVTTAKKTNSNSTQTSVTSKESLLVVHGLYMLRAAPDLKYLGFSVVKEEPNDPLNDVIAVYFNDESSKPGALTAPKGVAFAAIAGNIRPVTSCDLEIDATIEIKNPVFENRSGGGIGSYRVVSGDFVRLIKRGVMTDICPVDNGQGGVSYERKTVVF